MINVYQAVALAVYLLVLFAFGMPAAIGLAVAVVGFQVYWRVTRGEWFE